MWKWKQEEVDMEADLVVGFQARGGETPSYQFTAFQEDEFLLLLAGGVFPQPWRFYEVIRGNRPQKLYFDLDAGSPELFEVADGVLEFLLRRIPEVDPLQKDVILFSSHTETKRSYHIVCNGVWYPSNKHVKALAHLCCEGLTEVQRSVVDLAGCYKNPQQFRMVFSSKIGKGNTKVPIGNWFGTTLVQVFYPSLIGYVSDCVEGREVEVKIKEPEPFTPGMYMGAMSALWDALPDAITEQFKLGAKYGEIIGLKRTRPGMCPICAREHKSENAFLTVNSLGFLTFWCRRDGQDRKDGKKTPLMCGKIGEAPPKPVPRSGSKLVFFPK